MLLVGCFRQRTDLREKGWTVLFQDTSGDEVRRRLLSDHGMRYVYHGHAEKEMGDLRRTGASYLAEAMPIRVSPSTA
jgi:hypothetical protein